LVQNRLHQSAEGRERLRKAFSELTDRVPFGLRKITTIIADEHPGGQNEEYDRTRSALRRWAFSGQAHLWKKDPEKSARVLSRLENLMMSYDDIATALSAQSGAVDTAALQLGLHSFFAGALDPATLARPTFPEGLYSERRAYHGIEDNNGWSIHFSDLYLRLDETGSFYHADTFDLYAPENEVPRLNNRMSGFLYTTRRGDLVRFLVSPDNPANRRIDSLHSVTWSPRYAAFAPQKDPVFISRRDDLGADDGPYWSPERHARETGSLVVTALVRTDRSLPLVRKLIG
jgi:hypothetical protein